MVTIVKNIKLSLLTAHRLDVMAVVAESEDESDSPQPENGLSFTACPTCIFLIKQIVSNYWHIQKRMQQNL